MRGGQELDQLHVTIHAESCNCHLGKTAGWGRTEMRGECILSDGVPELLGGLQQQSIYKIGAYY